VNPFARMLGGALLFVGGITSLLGACLIVVGLIGIIVGMHGGPVSAGIAILLGVGPVYLGYSIIRKGWRLIRGAHKRRATSLLS